MEIAFWSVVKDVSATVAIPVAVFDEALPIYLGAAGASRKAGAVLFDALSAFDWDWPAWYFYAKKEGYDTISDISTSICDLGANKLLAQLSVPDLRRISVESGVKPHTGVTKAGLVDLLASSSNTAWLGGILDDLRKRQHQVLTTQVRLKMSEFLATRIMSVAHNMYRYEQLRELDADCRGTTWRFVWCGATHDAPRVCKKFDEVRLPRAQAMRRFPTLPCKFLQCGCYVVGAPM